MLSNYTINKLQDQFYRNQTFTLPASFYVALTTTVCTQAAMGTEVAVSNYARVAISRSLTNFSGTQGAGTTTVSTGTSGAVFNNIDIALGTPAAAWGTITSVVLMDASTGGNMLEYYNLPVTKQIVNPGDPVKIQIGDFSSTLTST